MLHVIPTHGTSRGCADRATSLPFLFIKESEDLCWELNKLSLGKELNICTCVCVYIYVYNHYIPPLYSAYRSLKIKLSKSNKTVFVTVTSHDMHVLNPL